MAPAEPSDDPSNDPLDLLSTLSFSSSSSVLNLLSPRDEKREDAIDVMVGGMVDPLLVRGPPAPKGGKSLISAADIWSIVSSVGAPV